MIPEYTGGHPLDYLSTIPFDGEAVTLFTAWAREEPDTPDDEMEMIGEVQLTGPLTRSVFGDERLFFRHEAFNRDLKRWTEMGE